MKKQLSFILIITISALCPPSFIKAQQYDQDPLYPHQNLDFDEGAGDDDIDYDSNPIKVKQYPIPLDDFDQILLQKIIQSKDHAVTTVLEQVPDPTGEHLIVIEHEIARLSLEKAQQLKELYSTELWVYSTNQIAVHDLKSCSKTRENIQHVKTLKKMALGTAALFLVTGSGLLYLFKNQITKNTAFRGLIAQTPRSRPAPLKAVRACSTIGGVLFFGSLAALAGAMSYLAMTLEPSSFNTDMCDYKDKLIAALDERIKEWQ